MMTAATETMARLYLYNNIWATEAAASTPKSGSTVSPCDSRVRVRHVGPAHWIGATEESVRSEIVQETPPDFLQRTT